MNVLETKDSTSVGMQQHQTQTQTHKRRDVVQYQSTPDGDVRTVVIEPSFDADDRHYEKSPGVRPLDAGRTADFSSNSKPPTGQLVASDNDGAMKDRARVDGETNDGGVVSSAKEGKNHTRNLSAHFLEATVLSDDSGMNGQDRSREQEQLGREGDQSHPLRPSGATQSGMPSYNRNLPVGRAALGGNEHTGDTSGNTAGGEVASSPSSAFTASPFRSGAPNVPSNDGMSTTAERPRPPNEEVAGPGSESYRPQGFLSEPVSGQKHRMVHSGPSNPVVAHRRINSAGNTAVVDRNNHHVYYTSQGQEGRSEYPSQYANPSVANSGSGGHHHREGSAGLDMLSAAADVSKEELAAVAGGGGSRTSLAQRNYQLPPRGSPRGSPRTTFSAAPPSYAPRNYSGREPHPPPHPQYHNHHPYRSHSPNQASYQGHHHHQYHPRQYHAGQHVHHPPSYYGSSNPPPYQYPRRSPSPSISPLYPVQYAQGKAVNLPEQPVLSHNPLPPRHRRNASNNSVGSFGCEKIETDEKLFSNGVPPSPPTSRSPPGRVGYSNGRSGTTTGVQTFVTAISVGDENRTMRASPTSGARRYSSAPSGNSVPSTVVASAPGSGQERHHRKMSSFSSIGTFMGLTEGAHSGDVQHKGQGPTTNFLQKLTDDAFLQKVSSSGSPVPSLSTAQGARQQHAPREYPASLPASAFEGSADSNDNKSSAHTTGTTKSSGGTSRFAAGGTSKRVRRKCTIEGCPNRVVQGGRCIAHGAKRKQCSFPGCSKNVKKAGLCSTHGPARKRCEAEGCTKVAVQGGRCIAHGAKKKLCAFEDCKKQAILAGMCKKHHDQKHGIVSTRVARRQSIGVQKVAPLVDSGVQSKASPPQMVRAVPELPAGGAARTKKPSHQRGLSFFQDMNNVETILDNGSIDLGSENVSTQSAPEERGVGVSFRVTGNDQQYPPRDAPNSETSSTSSSRLQTQRPPSTQRHHHQRGLSLFTDESMTDTILKGDIPM